MSRPNASSLLMRPPFALLTCALLFAVASNGRPQDGSSNNVTSTIQGTVVNSVTGEGIARALVFSPDDRFATFTDGQGQFEFKAPTSQNDQTEGRAITGTGSRELTSQGLPFALMARKPGFLDNPDRPTLMVPGADVTISLVPEAIIAGRIVTSDSDAAAGIVVDLFSRQVQDGRARWMRSQQSHVNSNGEFRFAGLRPGAYKVMTTELFDTDPADVAPKAQLYGFPPVCFPGVPDFASGQTIQVSAGQVFQADIALKRQPYFQVRVPLANSPEGSGINIRVLVQGHPGPGYSLGYNPNAQRIEGLLPKGNYSIEAASFGASPLSGSASINVSGNMTNGPTLTMVPSSPIQVNAREEFTSADANSSSTSSFNVGSRSFIFRSGPRAYLNLWLDPADDFNNHGSTGLRMPQSANDNALVIDGAQPGRYWVRAQTGRGYVASLTSGNTDLLHEPLTVTAGASPQINITLRDDFAKLSGKVLGLPDSPAGTSPSMALVFGDGGASPTVALPAAHIYCIPLPNSSGQFVESWVLSDGLFDVEQIPPGTYRVLAFAEAQPSLPYRDAEAMRAYESQGEVVHLSPGQTQQVQLQLISGEN